MDYEAEKMTIDVAKRMLDDAYNEVTFKNALVCVLDWCNYQRCVNIHKDTKTAYDDDGYKIEKYTQVKYVDKYVLTTDTTVDITKAYFTYDPSTKKFYRIYGGSGINPQAEGWYEYANPQTAGWYEKVKWITEYSLVPKSQISYYDMPHLNEWYENINNVYVLSEDMHGTGNYYLISNPQAGENPRDNGWYVNQGTQQSPDYVPTTDNNVDPNKAYYYCVYKDYYNKITKTAKLYEHTTDTVVDPDKTYYVEKGVDHYYPSTPEEIAAWDYSDHYERHVDITVAGLNEEVTLENKRPLSLT